jgi:hypothetical protein
MKPVLYLSAIVFVGLCAFWAYRVNYATREALGRVAHLQAEMAHERERMRMLNAEWAYLNRPDRLQTLVYANNELLQLVPLSPEQFGEAAMVAYPVEPLELADPLDLAVGERQ